MYISLTITLYLCTHTKITKKIRSQDYGKTTIKVMSVRSVMGISQVPLLFLAPHLGNSGTTLGGELNPEQRMLLLSEPKENQQKSQLAKIGRNLQKSPWIQLSVLQGGRNGC